MQERRGACLVCFCLARATAGTAAAAAAAAARALLRVLRRLLLEVRLREGDHVGGLGLERRGREGADERLQLRVRAEVRLGLESG